MTLVYKLNKHSLTHAHADSVILDQEIKSLSDLHQRPSNATDTKSDIDVGTRSSPPTPKHGQNSANCTDDSFTLRHRGHGFISQVVESVALVRDSEMDVYYRNNPMKSCRQLAKCGEQIGAGPTYKVD
jgi:hypothetical protein